MKTKVTLKLDAALLREAKTLAVQEGISIEAMLTAQLGQVVRKKTDYQQARTRAVTRLRRGMNLGWTPPRSRDELHER